MPKLENGYVRIASELLDAFCRIRIPGQQMQCLLFIIRKTYGFNKKEDFISLGQFSRVTGINRPHVVRALNGLLKKNVITKNGNSSVVKYGVNKNYRDWEPLPKKAMTYKAESSIKDFCYICNYDKSLVYHHIKHQADGGSDRVENIIRLCPNCHALVHKGEFTEKELVAKKGNVERSEPKHCQKRKSALPKKVMPSTKDNITIDTITKDILLRAQDFEKNAREILNGKTNISLLKTFIDYWTETHVSGKKLRFEEQKFFDVKKRYATFERREVKFVKKNSGAYREEGKTYDF